ncbi:MAG: hypothetical protein IKF98_13480, partial [Clostridia bacterium]|nr:hypothetical protein [Clostridia bacterium]
LVIASVRENGLADALDGALDAGAAGLPCRLSLTVGQVQVDANAPQTLDQCVQAADAKMYEIKKRKKAGQ